MSLVLEALRRIERPESKTGTVGVAVSSYRRAPKRSGFVPLLLGLVTGAALVIFFSPEIKAPRRTPTEAAPVTNPAPPNSQVVAPPKAGVAAVPSAAPRTIPERSASKDNPNEADTSNAPVDRAPSLAPRAARPNVTTAPRPAFVLQAISERDQHPIAIINDRLVKEGDMLGTARVLRIGEDSVTLLLENGKREAVRFAPPPEGSPEPF